MDLRSLCTPALPRVLIFSLCSSFFGKAEVNLSIPTGFHGTVTSWRGKSRGVSVDLCTSSVEQEEIVVLGERIDVVGSSSGQVKGAPSSAVTFGSG